MADIVEAMQRVAEDLLARPSGPLAIRFVIQPLMAMGLAVRDGLRDARTARSPYLWTILVDPHQRKKRLREGIAATARIAVLALALDAAYQLIELRTFYPGEAVIVMILLAFVPYLLVRGPAARIACWVRGQSGSPASRASGDPRCRTRE